MLKTLIFQGKTNAAIHGPPWRRGLVHGLRAPLYPNLSSAAGDKSCLLAIIYAVLLRAAKCRWCVWRSEKLHLPSGRKMKTARTGWRWLLQPGALLFKVTPEGAGWTMSNCQTLCSGSARGGKTSSLSDSRVSVALVNWWHTLESVSRPRFSNSSKPVIRLIILPSEETVSSVCLCSAQLRPSHRYSLFLLYSLFEKEKHNFTKNTTDLFKPKL